MNDEFVADAPIGKSQETDSPILKQADIDYDIDKETSDRANYKHCIYKNDKYSHGAALCVGGWIIHCYDGTWIQRNRKCIKAKPK